MLHYAWSMAGSRHRRTGSLSCISSQLLNVYEVWCLSGHGGLSNSVLKLNGYKKKDGHGDV